MSVTGRPLVPTATVACALLTSSFLAVLLGTVWLEAAPYALTPTECRLVLGLSLLPMAATARARRTGLIALAAGVGVVVSVLVAGVAIDATYDGQEYQYDATWALLHGWNPVWLPYHRFVAPGATALPWPEHYAWGTWLLLALAQGAGLSSEAAKGIFIVPAIAAGLVWYAALQDLPPIRRPLRVVLALLAAMSPTVLVEFPTRLNDGVMASLASAFLGFGLLYVRWGSATALGGMAAALALAVDTKFNALPIFGALTAGLCLATLLQAGWGRTLRLGGMMAGTTLAAVLVLGWHPYVTNAIAHGNPFWPIGDPAYEINTVYMPNWLRNEPVAVQTAYSVASRVGGTLAPKWPFTLSKVELGRMAGGTFWGGFGPWFSGAALLALLAGGATLMSPIARRRALPLLCVAVFGLLSAALVPQSWIARFVPQLWLAVFLLGLAALCAEVRLVRGLGATCLLVLGVNSGLVLLAKSHAEVKAVVAIDRSLSAAQRAGEICADFGAAHARIGLLRSRGVRVYPLHSRSPLQCAGGEQIPYALNFFDKPRIACPCNEVDHDPTGTWHAPPDTTVQDIRKRRQHPSSGD
jgi:hypothetical protein